MKWLPLLLVLIVGCSSLDRHMIVHPSDELYFDAEVLYAQEEFEIAAELYRQYLDEKPRSKYATAASLNLGMSLYYLKDYKGAMNALKDLKIEDANIKAYVEKIVKECAQKGGVSLADATQEKPKGAEITIEVTDAYLDLTNSLVLKGKVSQKATISANGVKTGLDQNMMFNVTTSWRKGRPVEILARGAENSQGSLDYYPDSEPPDEPEGLSTRNATSNSAEIEWNENREEDIKGYKVYYGPKGGGRKEVNELIERTSYEAVGLQRLLSGGNRTIVFTVRAIDKMNNESPDSDALEVTLP